MNITTGVNHPQEEVVNVQSHRVKWITHIAISPITPQTICHHYR
jgi:hypothetical protein